MTNIVKYQQEILNFFFSGKEFRLYSGRFKSKEYGEYYSKLIEEFIKKKQK